MDIRQKRVPPRKQAAKRKSEETASRPSPPAIPLPDPSQPLPAHFLRNQQALLGHAGLIAGVRPSRLATLSGTPRGASPSNPIVLDDHEAEILPEPPLIGRSQIDYFKNLDPSKLPTPSNQEIVEMLIKQKDIFPVLQSILKLLATGALGGKAADPAVIPGTRSWAARPNQSRSSSQPPAKKRKLNRVPAGAADWDVPYPFEEGEGPAAYRQNWMKERGRQLISQLIGLVKIAARKAAAKKHLAELEQKRQTSLERAVKQEQVRNSAGVVNKQGGRGANHYRDENRKTDSTPLVTQQSIQGNGLEMAILTSFEARNANLMTTAQSESALESTIQAETSASIPITQSTAQDASTASFNDLFSALLAASDANDVKSLGHTPLPSLPPLEFAASSQPAPNPPASIDTPSSSSDGNIDQSLIDSWMNIFQTFPLQTDRPSTSGPPSSGSVYLESLLGLTSPSNGEVSSFTSPTNGDSSSFSTTPDPDAQQAQSFPLDFNQLNDLEMAFNLAADGTSASDLGNFSSSASDTPLPIDFTFDFPALSQTDPNGAQAPTSTVIQQSNGTSGSRTSISQPSSSIGSQPGTSSIPPFASPRPDSLVFNNLIDPQLLALSHPELRTSTLLPQGLSSNTMQEAQPATSMDDAGTRSPSAPLPSPMSSFEPATPSSAGWDVSMAEVVGEQDQDRGMWWKGFLATDAEADIGGKGLGAVNLLGQPQAGQEREKDEHVGASDQMTPNKSCPSQVPLIRPTTQATQQTTGVTSAGTTTALPQPSGVFQVLRAADWQPQKPIQKLKKTDVLKRAEEKREELRAKLEKVKVKLWETTIEHGALLHLLRLSGETEKTSPAS